jgi:chromosome segregation ATPase
MTKGKGRLFNPIYATFEELIKENKGLFKLFRKAKNPGLVRAVWDSRQVEVETLNTQLLKREEQIVGRDQKIQEIKEEWSDKERLWFENFIQEREKERTYLQNIDEKEIDIDFLKKTLNSLENEIGQWQKRTKIIHFERERLEKLSRSLESALNIKLAEVKGLEKKAEGLRNDTELGHYTMIRQQEELEIVFHEKSELSAENNELTEKLEKSESKARQLKRFNFQLENELYKSGHQIDELQQKIELLQEEINSRDHIELPLRSSSNDRFSQLNERSALSN